MRCSGSASLSVTRSSGRSVADQGPLIAAASRLLIEYFLFNSHDHRLPGQFAEIGGLNAEQCRGRTERNPRGRGARPRGAVRALPPGRRVPRCALTSLRGIIRGKAAIREQLETTPEATWLGTWGPLQPAEAERRMDPRVVAAEGEHVTVLYTQRALGPDGERFESPVLGLYEVRDGKLARAQMFHYDTAAILAFLERAASPEQATAA